MPARVCICDDDPVIGQLLHLDLAAAGFSDTTALSTTAAAIEHLTAAAPDILLLDINMPGGGGLDLLAYMRTQGLLADTRVLMLTGEDDTWFMERAKGMGASGYLTKPVDTRQLMAKIHRLLADPQVRWIDDLSILTSPGLTVARRREEAAAATVAAPAAVEPARSRILSVEDVACNQQLVTLFLEAERYAVDQVQGGLDALAAIAAKQYDLMLLDLRLPDLDGLEVVRRVRAGERDGRRLPIVAVTADVLPERLAEAQAAGVDDHVTKPFTSATLRGVVARHCGQPGPASLESLNPIVADLAQTYGKATVESLLRALMVQLAKLDDDASPTEPLEDAAHAIKGAAASLGFTLVSTACLELEDACRAGKVVAPPLRRASEACERASRQIASCLAQAA